MSTFPVLIGAERTTVPSTPGADIEADNMIFAREFAFHLALRFPDPVFGVWLESVPFGRPDFIVGVQVGFREVQYALLHAPDGLGSRDRHVLRVDGLTWDVPRAGDNRTALPGLLAFHAFDLPRRWRSDPRRPARRQP